MTSLHITPEFALFCDTIRREDTGKIIFVGVYTQGLAVPSFPFDAAFSVYMHGKFIGTGSTNFEIRIVRQTSGEIIHSIIARSAPLLNLAPDLKFEIMTSLLGCPVSQPETVLAQMKCEGNEWETFGSLKISLPQPPPLSSIELFPQF